MTPSKYIIKPLANRKIHSFYYNVAKKYKHTYDFDDFVRDVQNAVFSMATPSPLSMLAMRRTCTSNFFSVLSVLSV